MTSARVKKRSDEPAVAHNDTTTTEALGALVAKLDDLDCVVNALHDLTVPFRKDVVLSEFKETVARETTPIIDALQRLEGRLDAAVEHIRLINASIR